MTSKYLSPLVGKRLVTPLVPGADTEVTSSPTLELGHHEASQPQTCKARAFCSGEEPRYDFGGPVLVHLPLEQDKSLPNSRAGSHCHLSYSRSMCEPVDTFLSAESAASRAFQVRIMLELTLLFLFYPCLEGASR